MPEIIVKLGERIIHRYFFDKDVLSVGRARDNDIVIENLSVSRNHSRIKREGGKYILTDMNSANGTLVNGVRVTRTEVFHNDVITVGKHTLHFVDAELSEEAGAANAPMAVEDPSTSGEPHAQPIPEGGIGVLLVTKGKQAGQEFAVQKAETFIGRASENDVRLHDWFVSKKHASIRRQGNSFLLKDLDSWRGTTVDGNSVREIDLKPGHEITLGTTVLAFRVMDAEEFARSHPKSEGAASASSFEGDKAWETSSVSKVGIPVSELQMGDPGTAKPRSSSSRVSAPAAKKLPPAEPATSRTARKPSSPRIEKAVEESEDVVRLDEEIVPKAPAEPPPAGDDEFAPMTDDELEALERDADEHDGSHTEEVDARRLSWEMHEAEKMFELGEGEEHFSFLEKDEALTLEEERATNSKDVAEGLMERQLRDEHPSSNLEEEEREEERALEGKTEEPSARRRKPAPTAPKVSTPAPTVAAPDDQGGRSKEVDMWEKALKNKSRIIRRNAAKELKRLTGKDYDWESEPAGT